MNETIERAAEKTLEKLDDALMHLQNVKGLSHDEMVVVGSSIDYARQILKQALGVRP